MRDQHHVTQPFDPQRSIFTLFHSLHAMFEFVVDPPMLSTPSPCSPLALPLPTRAHAHRAPSCKSKSRLLLVNYAAECLHGACTFHSICDFCHYTAYMHSHCNAVRVPLSDCNFISCLSVNLSTFTHSCSACGAWVLGCPPRRCIFRQLTAARTS